MNKRKIILDLAVSLDGFIEGPNGETDWCVMDEDMDFPGLLADIDTIFYGRISYEMWGNFQPQTDATEVEKLIWAEIHSKEKIVFSGIPRPDAEVTFISSDLVEKIDEMRQQEGKNIWLYGGANLIKTFIRLKLIDIYRISVHPIVLGGGIPLFSGLDDRLHLQLEQANTFSSGVVQLIYQSVE